MFNAKKKLAKLIIACMAIAMPVTASFPAQADASVLGAIIGAGIQATMVNEQLKQLNNTEEGRQQLFTAMKEKQGVNEDPALNQRLDGIMTNLTAAIGAVDESIYDMPYNYFINQETSFNAACSLGHNMTVNTGIFTLLSTDDEIAVVLGHEMGHGQKNHVLKGYQKSIPVSILATAASAGGGVGGTLAASIAANYIDAVHITKPQEWEADELSFEYMTHSNYNIGATAAVWQKVMEEYGTNQGNFAGDIFNPSDHPSHEERRNAYAKQISEYSHDIVSAADGSVYINGTLFVTPVSIESMSGAERSYFVAGNLARYFHDNKDNVGQAFAYNGTVYVGEQAIMTPCGEDTSAQELADLFNTLEL